MTISYSTIELEIVSANGIARVAFNFIALGELRGPGKTASASPRMRRANKYYNRPSCNDALIHLHSGLSQPDDVGLP